MIRGVPPLPEVIGIYPEPPPEEVGGIISSQRVANIGAVPLLEGATRLRDRLYELAGHLLP